MKLKKQQDRGRKHAKILAAMLVFLLCGCNHRDTEYKLSDSTGGSTAENVFGNQKEVDEEQTVSEKSAGETTGIPEKREAQEAAPEETVQVFFFFDLGFLLLKYKFIIFCMSNTLRPFVSLAPRF